MQTLRILAHGNASARSVWGIVWHWKGEEMKTSFETRRNMSTLFRLSELVKIIKSERLNTWELASRLEVPERTVGRDLKCLRDMFDHQIGFKRGYYYVRKPKMILGL
jgi:hypothetical protein